MKLPFWAQFLEAQEPDDFPEDDLQAGPTVKYPSDGDDVTFKYPSDGDESPTPLPE